MRPRSSIAVFAGLAFAALGVGAYGLTVSPRAAAAGPSSPLVDLSETTLVVALVEDPDFPALDERLVQKALRFARREFRTRFAAEPPRMSVRYRFRIQSFVSTYARADDPRCKDLFAARYQGHGPAELAPFEATAKRFLKRWDLGAIRGFVDDDKVAIRTYDDAYDYYVRHYTSAIRNLQGLKTPAGTPLVEPAMTSARSFVGWLCALKRQDDYDVILTNTFILSDLMTEPHPHSVFGKAKIGGIAVRSPSRPALGGQVLLATTFGIDTDLAPLSELNGMPASVDERAEILGAYLLAHEIAHAVFGIPDVFDHPPGCLMTSRPGASYRDGLTELRQYPRPCPRCRPYVESRGLLADARAQLAAGHPELAALRARRAISILPKHFHGRRRTRLSDMSVVVSQAYAAQGRDRLAQRYATLATRLDPASLDAKVQLASLVRPTPGTEAMPAGAQLRPKGANAVPATRTTTVAPAQVD